METSHQTAVADYNAYLQLARLKYTNADIATHLSFSLEQLGQLISKFAFMNALEFIPTEKTGPAKFEGRLCLSQLVIDTLTTEEVQEIVNFNKTLVEQHSGVYYIQHYYAIEHDCGLIMIDLNSQSLKEPYTLLLSSNEYYVK